ncbi:MAG: hypothetical protein JWM87_2396 [Candidatus Eremiobacteraeota bacterium]|nr:hypothetical protein [Candidatus Eremiobacteraeota bacterium]
MLDAQVMDIYGANPAPATNVIAFPQKPSGTDNQRWRLVASPVQGYYFVQSLLNGFVLDILGANTAARDADHRVSAENRWYREPALAPGSQRRGSYFLESKLNGFVIDIRGANTAPATQLIAFPKKPTGIDNQVWKFIPRAARPTTA